MCYDGALVMPSSYAVMDENEMMYLEGAAKIQSKLGIAGFVLGFTSVGGFIANMWDVKDGKINGYVNIG